MLREKAIKAVKWTSLSAAVKGIFHFLQYSLLAHYLTPAEFGSFGIVMLIIGFGQMYTDGGMANAIIHFQDMTKKQLSTLYWFNIALGAGLYAGILIGAPFLARFYHAGAIVSLCNWAGLVFLIIPFGVQFQALMQKELLFDRLAKIYVLSTMIGGTVSIVAMVMGSGVYSLIIGLLITTGVRTGLLLRYGLGNFRPIFYFSLREIRTILKFGLYQVGQKLIGFIGSRADQLIIGKFIGLGELGYYNLAYNLVILPIQGVNPIITRVAFPIYSKIQGETGKLVRGYSEMLKLLALINFPFFFILIVFAAPVIDVIYGAQWIRSAELVKILTVVGIVCALSNPLGSILLAKGRADVAFKWDIFVCLTSLASVSVASRFGVLGVASTLSVLYLAYFVLEYFVVLEPLIGNFRSSYFVHSFLIPISYAAAAGVAMFAFNQCFHGGKYATLGWGIAIGGIVFALCIFSFEKPLLKRYLGGRILLPGFSSGAAK